MTTYDIGDRVPLRHYVRDPDGTLTNATMTLGVTSPSGTTSTPSITNTSTGLYDASVTVTEAGVWFYVWTAAGAVVEVTEGQFTVFDPNPPSYADLVTLKLGWDATTTTHDALLSRNLAAASRMIDDHCHRRFWADADASARTYAVQGRTVLVDDGEVIFTDDIASTTGLIVATGSGSTYTTVDSSQYETYPRNAIANRMPIEGILRLGAEWPRGVGQRVRVTGRWGWPAIPDVVEQACLLQAGRLYKRKDSPQGVLANAEWGSIRVASIDPDVARLLRRVVKHAFA